MSSHGSEKRRAREEPEESDSWGEKLYGKNHLRQRRETSTSTQRSESWHWVRHSPSREDSGGSASASGALARSSGAWTLWKDVDKNKYKTEEGAERKEERKPWSPRGHLRALGTRRSITRMGTVPGWCTGSEVYAAGQEVRPTLEGQA